MHNAKTKGQKLGFGLMRLPQIDGEKGRIDVEQTKRMVDMFIDAGQTYFDTAWVYAGSEDAMREALVSRYPRDKYTIATKLAAWAGCKTREDAIAQFETSVERSGTDWFDYYLLHNLGNGREKFFDDFGLWDWALEMKEKGRIRSFGFSFHAEASQLDAILSAHPEVDFVQLQINWADWESPLIQSRACYETAQKHGKPVVVMEPVKGGMLAKLPPSVDAILKAASPSASPASWAVKFAADLDGAFTVLSGMSSVEQMEDNLSYMRTFDGLTDDERTAIASARAELAKIPLIPCTQCNYCAKVCPENVGISGTFDAMNILTLYGDKKFASHMYNVVGFLGHARADACVKCGACEDVCPQRIAIRDELARAAEAFGK